MGEEGGVKKLSSGVGGRRPVWGLWLLFWVKVRVDEDRWHQAGGTRHLALWWQQ